MRLTLKYPTRGRPEQFLETLLRWIDMATAPKDSEFIVSIDRDDRTMIDALVDDAFFIQKPTNVHVFSGDNKTKTEATNADMCHATGDIFMIIAEDLIPMVKGYDEIIAEDMAKHFPDGDGILHYDDGIQGDKLCTHPVMGRKYFDRTGHIIPPYYLGLLADNELTEVARGLGRIKFMDHTIFQHDHHSLGGRASDQLNARDIVNGVHDQRVFNERKARGFPRE